MKSLTPQEARRRAMTRWLKNLELRFRTADIAFAMRTLKDGQKLLGGYGSLPPAHLESDLPEAKRPAYKLL